MGKITRKKVNGKTYIYNGDKLVQVMGGATETKLPSTIKTNAIKSANEVNKAIVKPTLKTAKTTSPVPAVSQAQQRLITNNSQKVQQLKVNQNYKQQNAEKEQKASNERLNKYYQAKATIKVESEMKKAGLNEQEKSQAWKELNKQGLEKVDTKDVHLTPMENIQVQNEIRMTKSANEIQGLQDEASAKIQNAQTADVYKDKDVFEYVKALANSPSYYTEQQQKDAEKILSLGFKNVTDNTTRLTDEDYKKMGTTEGGFANIITTLQNRTNAVGQVTRQFAQGFGFGGDQIGQKVDKLFSDLDRNNEVKFDMTRYINGEYDRGTGYTDDLKKQIEEYASRIDTEKTIGETAGSIVSMIATGAAVGAGSSALAKALSKSGKLSKTAVTAITKAASSTGMSAIMAAQESNKITGDWNNFGSEFLRNVIMFNAMDFSSSAINNAVKSMLKTGNASLSIVPKYGEKAFSKLQNMGINLGSGSTGATIGTLATLPTYDDNNRPSPEEMLQSIITLTAFQGATEVFNTVRTSVKTNKAFKSAKKSLEEAQRLYKEAEVIEKVTLNKESGLQRRAEATDKLFDAIDTVKNNRADFSQKQADALAELSNALMESPRQEVRTPRVPENNIPANDINERFPMTNRYSKQPVSDVMTPPKVEMTVVDSNNKVVAKTTKIEQLSTTTNAERAKSSIIEDLNSKGQSVKDGSKSIVQKNTEAVVTTESGLPVAGETRESSLMKTIEKSPQLTEESKAVLRNDNDIRFYEADSNPEQINRASKNLNDPDGYSNWLSRTEQHVKNKTSNADDVVEGFLWLQKVQESGQYDQVTTIVRKLREMGKSGGRVIQTFTILSRMDPEGMLAYAQGQLDAAWERVSNTKAADPTQRVDNKKGQKPVKWLEENRDYFVLSEQESADIALLTKMAATAEPRAKAICLGKIQQIIQNKIPSTFGQKIKSLQRTSLLLNPKTNVRNFVGNAVMIPERVVADVFATPIDKLIAKKTGTRTTGLPNVKSFGKGFKKGASEAFEDFRMGISTRVMGDRFEIGNDGPAWNVELAKTKLKKAVKSGNKAQITKARINLKLTQAMNRLDGVTSFMLELGDRPFFEGFYMNSLENQMKLNGVKEPTPEMIEIATTEALEATYQDNNGFTKAVSRIRRGMNFGLEFGPGNLVIPFSKTPANIMRAFMQFSPAGLVKSVSSDAIKFNNALKSPSGVSPQMQRKFVSNLGKGISGTLAMLLGGLLVSNTDAINGKLDSDKDVAAFQRNQLGKQAYSVSVNGKSYTYDWASPVGTQLALMADIIQNINREDSENDNVGLGVANGMFNGIMNALVSGGNTMFEQSFLSGISELFSNNSIVEGMLEIVLNAGSTFIPALTSLNQVGQLTDDTSRRTYEYNDMVGSALNQIKSKVPGLNKTLEPTVDAYGNEVERYGGENNAFNVMVNPANVTTENPTDVSREIDRLYQATGDKTIFPQKAANNIKVEGNNLEPKELTQYQKVMGKATKQTLDTIIKTDYYKNMTDDEKVKVISTVNKLATTKAKADYCKTKGIPYEEERSSLADPVGYALYKAKLTDDMTTTDKKKLIDDIATELKLTDEKAASIYRNTIESSSTKETSSVDYALEQGLTFHEFITGEINTANEKSKEKAEKEANLEAISGKTDGYYVASAKGYAGVPKNITSDMAVKIKDLGITAEEYYYIKDTASTYKSAERLDFLSNLNLPDGTIQSFIYDDCLSDKAHNKCERGERELKIPRETYVDVWTFGYKSTGTKKERNEKITEYVNGLSGLNQAQKEYLIEANAVYKGNGSSGGGSSDGGSSGGSSDGGSSGGSSSGGSSGRKRGKKTAKLSVKGYSPKTASSEPKIKNQNVNAMLNRYAQRQETSQKRDDYQAQLRAIDSNIFLTAKQKSAEKKRLARAFGF